LEKIEIISIKSKQKYPETNYYCNTSVLDRINNNETATATGTGLYREIAVTAVTERGDNDPGCGDATLIDLHQ
jgi:hypothetical protein